MPNPHNLKRPSKKEARRRGRKGGIASGKAKRERKTFKYVFERLLSLNAPDKLKESIKTAFPQLSEAEIDIQTAAAAKVMSMIFKGGANAVQAYKEVRDTIGEQPVAKVQEMEPVKIIDDV